VVFFFWRFQQKLNKGLTFFFYYIIRTRLIPEMLILVLSILEKKIDMKRGCGIFLQK